MKPSNDQVVGNVINTAVFWWQTTIDKTNSRVCPHWRAHKQTGVPEPSGTHKYRKTQSYRCH